MKYRPLLSFIMAIVGIMFFTGCLTVEEKEYIFHINSDGSGTGKIVYINIVSEEDEGEDKSFADFGELISDYVDGNQFERDNPGFNVTDKDLFVKDGELIGIVEFTFENADSIGFYFDKNCDCASTFYYIGTLSETLKETNGTYLGEGGNDMPLVTWDDRNGELYFRTIVKDDMSDAHKLDKLYTMWKESK